MSRTPLVVGTEIDRFLIKQMLSEDGRGISYLAVDTRSVSSSTKVLVREYFPRGISVRDLDEIEPRDRMEAQEEFERGLAGFIEAGKTLISIETHSLVPAIDIIEQNSTAYLVLEWPEGRDFTEMTSEDDPMDLEALQSQLAILQTGLEQLHQSGLIHMAISPSTLIRLDDGYPAISHLTHVERFEGDALNRAHILFDTPYAAPELRCDSDAPVGPWTDVYGLSATCWYMLTGLAPASAEERLSFIAAGRGDKLDPNIFRDIGYDQSALVDVLLAGLELVPERRIASVSAFIARFNAAASRSRGGLLASVRWFAVQNKTALLGTAAALALGFVLVSNVTADPSPGVDIVAGEVDHNAADLIVPPKEIRLPDTPRLLASAAWLLVDRNSADEVRAFISKYNDSIFTSSVALERLQLLDERAWSLALSEGSIESFEAYLADFGPESRPVGLHVDQAKARIISISGAREFQIAEARRLMFELGYNTNTRTGETPGLVRAVAGFQESIGVEADGEFSDLLIEQLSQAVATREAEKAIAAEKLKAEKAAAQLAEEQALAEARYIALVREAAGSTTRTATGKIGRISQDEPEKTLDPRALKTPPSVEPRVVFETKVAGSALASKRIQTEELEPVQEVARAPGDMFRDCDTCPEMKVVPAGSFDMGSSFTERDRQTNEGPVHTVEISANFAIATKEVSLGEYSVFVRETNRRLPTGCYAETDAHMGEWAYKAELNFRSPGFSQSASNPVVCVSWQDARDYTRWLSAKTGHAYRLPSETEWEYAARAGSKAARHFGRGFRNGCKYLNGADRTAKKSRKNWVTASCTDGYLATAPVGKFAPNAFGLYDMLGNVWEWTADCYTDNYDRTPRNEAAHTQNGCKTYVTRGGSWASGIDMLRSAARSGDGLSARYDMLGFRVVRELPQP